ncbi:MAG: LysR family transcriptional regulator [Candidatus Azotimanducaceae bacterium]
MTDLRLLKNFVAVFHSRSFRAAAEELGVSQSSVTKRIQLLEGEVSLRLFNRTTRAVEPTDNARKLITAAENALQAESAFNEEAQLMAGGKIGAIRVGAMALAAETLVVHGLARLAQTHPDLEVEVIVGSSDIYKELVTGQCDVAIGDEANFQTSVYAPSLRLQPLHREKLVYVHRSDHPAAGVTQKTELLSYPLAVPSRYFNENKLFETMARDSNPRLFPRYRLNSLSACLTLAANSDAIALAPQSLTRQTTSADQTAGLTVADFDTGVEVAMALVSVASNAPTPAVRAFGAALSQGRRRSP